MPSIQQTTQALIRHFDDDRLKSEDELGHALSMLSMVPEISYETFLKKLLLPPPYISQPTLELVFAGMSAPCLLRGYFIPLLQLASVAIG